MAEHPAWDREIASSSLAAPTKFGAVYEFDIVDGGGAEDRYFGDKLLFSIVPHQIENVVSSESSGYFLDENSPELIVL